MCRTQGRRCEEKWDDAHRERYNARRRIARNKQKAEQARANDQEEKAAYYDSLVQSAAKIERELDASIRSHELEGGNPADSNGDNDSNGPNDDNGGGSPSGPIAEHPLASKPAAPLEVSYIRNPVSSATHAVNHDFGQDVEPSGRYISQSSGMVPDGWESGTVRFEKPLHLQFGESGLYTDDDNWKRRLSGHYGGKAGKALSEALRAEGYDGIVTHDKYGTSEIVDLRLSR